MSYETYRERYKAQRQLPEDWENWTWTTIHNFLHAHGFGDDEYVSLYENSCRNIKIWGAETRDIDVTWKTGGSEGYYCRAVVYKENGNRDTALICKFWDAHRAEWCANLLTRVLWHNGRQMNYDHLLPTYFRNEIVLFNEMPHEVMDVYADGTLDIRHTRSIADDGFKVAQTVVVGSANL